MSGEFDPYYQWLGIPPTEQPPSHYRLLGLADFESNSDVIENAADRQMAHLRNYQSGKHADESQQLLNEIAAAKRCLLTADKKSAYDAALKSKDTSVEQERPLMAAEPLVATKPKPKAKPAVVASPATARQPDPIGAAALPAIAAKPAPQIDRGRPSDGSIVAPLVVAIGGGALVLLLLVGSLGAFLFLFRSSPDPGPVVVAPGPVAPQPRVHPVRPQPPDRPSPRQPVNNPQTNRFPGPSGPAPIILNPNGPPSQPPTTPATNPQPTGPLRPTKSLNPEEAALPEADPDRPPEVETPVASFFPPEEEDTRSPVPDEADRARRRKQIDDVFSPDEQRNYQEKVKVAQDMLTTGRESQGEPAAQYALFHRAQEVAAEAGNLRLAFEAVDKLDATFQIDGDALRIAAVSAAAGAAAPPSARKESVQAGIKLVDQLFADDRYVEAAKVINVLQSIARKTPDRDELQKLGEQNQLGSELIAAHRRASDAIEKLKADPGDASAATAAGRYFVFAKGDWQLGLPMLAAGDDETLKKIAEQEMAVPGDVNNRKQLADAWRTLAESSAGVEARRQNARAAMWYKRIVGQLSGLAKVEVDKHIRTIGDVAVSGGETFQPGPTPTRQTPVEQPGPAAPKVGEPIDLLALINTDLNAVQGEWGFFGEGVLLSKPETPARLQIPYSPPETYILEVEATRVAGRSTLAIGLIYDDIPCHVAIDGWDGTGSAILASRDGANRFFRRLDGPQLTTGQSSKIRCVVQRDGFLVQCDGREVIRHVGPPSWDATSTGYEVPDKSNLALGARDSTYHIHVVRLTPIPPGALPPPQAAPPSVERSFDLLSRIDLRRHAGRGTWNLRNGELIVTGRGLNDYLLLPYQPAAPYRVEIETTRTSGDQAFALGLVAPSGEQFAVVFDAFGRFSGITTVDGKEATRNETRHIGQIFPTDQRRTIVCDVLPDAVAVSVDGEKIVDFQGKASRLGLNDFWKVRDAKTLFVGSTSGHVIHSLRVTPLDINGATAATGTAGKPVDLLALLDPTEHAIAGNWRKQNGELISPITQFARMQIPVHAPKQYDLEIEATRKNGYLDLCIGLVYQGRQCHMAIDRYRPPVTQMLVDKKAHAPREYVATYKGSGNLLAPNTRAKIKCEVRSDSVRLLIDDKQILQYSGEASWTGMNDDWVIPDKQALMIGSWSAIFQIHSIKLTPVSGNVLLSKDATPPAAGDAVDLLKMIDLTEHVVAGDWEVRNNVLFTARDRNGRVTIPYEPPESYRIEIDSVQRLGLGPLIVGLVHQGQQFAVEVGRAEGRIHALDGQSRTDKRGPFIMIGRPTKIICEVTPEKVTVTCNDRTAVEYRGDADRLSLPDDWKVPSEKTLFIGSSQCLHHVTAMKLTLLE